MAIEFSSSIEIDGNVIVNLAIVDSNSSIGTVGQVLTSTGSVSEWANAPADTNNYVNSLAFSTATGVLTLGRSGLASLTVDLDGRYVTSSGVTSIATTNGITGGTITGSGTIQVDSTVVRTTGAQSIGDVKTFTSRADFTNGDGLRTNQVRTYGGQQLVLNAGESSSYATGQTAENVYVNAEAGLQINSSPDNWSSGWAGRTTANINAEGGASTLPGTLTIIGDLTIYGTGRIQGVDTVTSNTDATNKLYVDNAVNGAGVGTFLPLSGGALTGALVGTTANFAGLGEFGEMLTIDITDISTGENRGLKLLNSNGVDQQWNITAGQSSVSNDHFTVRDATNNRDALVINTSGKSFFAGEIEAEGHITISGGTKNLYIINSDETQAGIVFSDTQAGTGQRAAIKFDSGTETLDFFVNDETTERMSINTSGVLTLNSGSIVLSGTGRIQGIDNVISSTDAVNKAYVDNAVSIVTPATPTTITSTIVGETIEVAFNQSSTSNIDYYQVWSSDDGADYGIVAQIAPDGFSSTMTIVDTSFYAGGTMSYKVYAVKGGVYSSAGTTSKAYTVGALSVTNMSVTNLNTAYYVQYEKPTTRFLDHIEIYMDSETTQAALSRVGAVLVYSGQNHSYMQSVGNNNNFHQFWVEVVTS